MVKIACAAAVVLLVLCQLAEARSAYPNQALQLEQTNASAVSEPSLGCAHTLVTTLRSFYTATAESVLEKFQKLSEERRRCEYIGTPTDAAICWARYQVAVILATVDVLESFMNREETFAFYAEELLYQYVECREAETVVYDALEEIVAELGSTLSLATEVLIDTGCARDLTNNVLEYYEQFNLALIQRMTAARTIRRRCERLERQPAKDQCWSQWRLSVLFGISDTLRDIEYRNENYNRMTTQLLESYYVCRTNSIVE